MAPFSARREGNDDEQAPKYICARLISSSFPGWRKKPSEKTLNLMLVFYASNGEVNSRSIDFQIFYILKQQFIKSVCKSLSTFTIKIKD